MNVNKYSIEQIMDFVLEKAKNQRENPDPEYSSLDYSESDLLKVQVKYFQFGMEGKIPPEWEKFIPPATEAEIRMENHPIQFEYCECGCKCHSATSKGISYSIYNSLEGSHAFTLMRGHGRFGRPLGPKLNTFQAAVTYAQADFDKIP
jgi:hypothetical protein